MPSGCLGGTFGGLGDTFGVIWGVLVARSAYFGGPWWHFWPHLGCLGDTFGVIGAVLGRLGRPGPPKIEKVAILAWLFGVVFNTKIAPKMHQKMDPPKRTNKC